MSELSFTVTFLGTGTSQGIPVIGCDCPVCQSADPRDQRLRTSVLLEFSETNILIDAGPDLRQQMLREKVEDLHSILLTHEHNDHIVGLDDVRPFNFKYGRDMPAYALPRVCEVLKLRFSYIFAADKYPGSPMIELIPIEADEPFEINHIPITPIELQHGRMPILGFRIGNFAYLTDMKTIKHEEMDKLKGLEVLIVNALHKKTHHSHLNLEEALAFIEQVNPKQAYLTHLSHSMGLHAEVEKELPENVKIAYDGLKFGL